MSFIHLGKRINYYSTAKIESDGIHTEWNQNAKGDINLMPNFQFEVKMPSLAFLEIEVKDGYFGDLGIFCSPITMIKEHGKNFSIFPFTPPRPSEISEKKWST